MSRTDRALVNLAHRQAGVCPLGHDISTPNALSESRRNYRCRACQVHYRTRRVAEGGRCGMDLHDVPPGTRGCQPCRNRRDRERRSAELKGAVIPFPPKAVRDGARCTPATATLFDPITRDEQTGTHRRGHPERVDQAKAICEHCPVKLRCLADALEWRRVGVYGGEYVGPAVHLARAKRAQTGNAVPEDLTSWEAERTMAV